MKPTLAADELRRNIIQYLTTTFALDDDATRDALERFFTDPVNGIFRGPYLRIRAPFRQAESGWRKYLEWVPARFNPYRHQAEAFKRLSTRRGPAKPTLITTGTGSGKTESFLIPILDHCARARRSGKSGVKAILLYPMNALATDQAHRINDYLQDPALKGVIAGLYIGDTPETEFSKVLTGRSEIRRTSPDILITNYKMLDLLLQREDDLRLWDDADPAFVVVDEFHTYDGAQGTDVAMLLRRMAAALGVSEPGRPLGRICPVATSATLASNDIADHESRAQLLTVAGQVFGTPFTDAAVIGEDRLTVEEFVPSEDMDYTLPLPSPQELAALPDPANDPTAMDQIAGSVLGQPSADPSELGARLRRHILTSAVLAVLSDRPADLDEMLARLPRHGAYAWGAAVRTNPTAAATALARFVALLSHARDPGNSDRPLVNVEAHLWIRAVTRLMREVNKDPAFLWSDDRPEPDSGGNTVYATGEETEARTTIIRQPGRYLPAVYCRHCGRSGWMTISPEANPTELITKTDRIYRANFTTDRRRQRPLIQATDAEAGNASADAPVYMLDPVGDQLHPIDLSRDTARPGVAVLADVRRDKAADDAAADGTCPACGMKNGILFLGAGLATLASVAITELFTGGELAVNERKTLLFNDSVQDAAHRAGFVADRAYTFSLRALLTRQIPEDTPMALNDLLGDLLAAAIEQETLAAVVPPDLHGLPGVHEMLSGSAVPPDTWELVGERLAFAAICEFGLRSRQGRTLELTRTAAIEVAVPEAGHIAALAKDVHLRLSGQITTDDTLPGIDRYLTFIHGLLQRLRTSGAIKHHWLDRYIHNGGVRRWLIWGGRQTGMPAFPRGISAPTFLLQRPRRGSGFDFGGAPGSWYVDWAMRCLGLPRTTAPTYLSELLPVLAESGVISAHTTEHNEHVFGLLPGHLHVRLIPDDLFDSSVLACDECHRYQTLFPGNENVWRDEPCPRFRCRGALRPAGSRASRNFQVDYYRQLYRSAGPYQVVASEHTGVLSRAQREHVEEGFRNRSAYTDPNVLSATPTLELGIDIGDLSAVILASLPMRPANYVQRVGRAGRRTGNSFLVTLIGRRPRDLYYISDPLEMIAGAIAPPGCYLAAVEILRRQYLAHLVDCAARGRLPGVLPLPRRTSQLFGDSGWLNELVAAAVERADELVAGFLALFPLNRDDEVGQQAHNALREFANAGIKDKAHEAAAIFARRMDDLRGTLRSIEEAMTGLVTQDTEHVQLQRELSAERRQVRHRINDISVRADAHGTLVELGLLPNYSLIDSRTTLEATLSWQQSAEDNQVSYHSDLREYDRAGELALTELAPGNTFYVNGYKHKITGLDAGSEARPLWQVWRVCPDCGYARTHRATEDTSRCPRCRGGAIADQGNVHKVLVPERVMARDRRDDSRVSDDSDDRDRMYYEVTSAVDIENRHIAAGAWRHRDITFGLDFARQATVRHYNLGRQRFDVQPTGSVAGEQVRVTGFGVCPKCGYASPDDPGQLATAANGTGTIADNPHRPWCPRKRNPKTGSDERLLLVHELTTEAIRILLPAVTIMVEERRASFAAALRAGIAAHYRGNPEHLKVTKASMPDQETGERRRFLVLYDSLPGGTGYLHRLATPKAFRDVLESARAVIVACTCVDQGKPACHRCLLAYVPAEDHPLVSRAEAVRMLDDLLGQDGSAFTTRRVMDAAAIPLARQVDSELENQFVEGLRAWCNNPRTPGSLGSQTNVDGKEVLHLRVDSPDRSHVTHWQVELQHNLEDQIPDVMFSRLDGPPVRVAVYLDGYRYHASVAKNQIAVDAGKRMRLRASGMFVFQLTWDDVTTVVDGDHADHAWRPYLGVAQHAARRRYQQLGGRGEELDELIWTNPMQTLLAFLGDPDSPRWPLRAEAVLTGLLAHEPGNRTSVTTNSAGAPELLRAAFQEEVLPASAEGKITIVRHSDNTGCRLVIAVDQRDSSAAAISGFTVLDDRATTIKSDQESHRRRWTAWLRWGDVLQFLSGSTSDGMQLAITDTSLVDPALLAIGGGTGAFQALRAEERGVDPLAEQEQAPLISVDINWRAALDLMDQDEPGLAALARELAAMQVSAPVVGFELGDEAWQAELAWPDTKVAVVLDLGHGAEEDQLRRDAAYADAGWETHHAMDWSADKLAQRIQADSREGPQ
jgi:replicative superfamily II helicase